MAQRCFIPRNIDANSIFLNSDIVMQFDECTPYPATPSEADTSLNYRCVGASAVKCAWKLGNQNALFGIIQGEYVSQPSRKIPRRVARYWVWWLCHWWAVSRWAKEEMMAVLDYPDDMPADKPRYLMGVGKPEDIVEAVRRGVDMFDCVMPTRNARNGHYFTTFGAVKIKMRCTVLTKVRLIVRVIVILIQNFSRAYLHHLFKCNEMLSAIVGHHTQFTLLSALDGRYPSVHWRWW